MSIKTETKCSEQKRNVLMERNQVESQEIVRNQIKWILGKK